jgi:hypothetical protein
MRAVRDRRFTLVFALIVAHLGAFSAAAADRYVSPTGTHSPPFLNWSKAATNIQAAVDVCNPGDRVWVTNGVYDTGGAGPYAGGSNRVAVTKAITVSSINGPEFTVIAGRKDPGSADGRGPSAIRGVYLGYGAVLTGFTITNGATSGNNGGGAYCELGSVVSNCVFHANSGDCGGAIYSPPTYTWSVPAIVTDCQFLTNTAQYGGAACQVRLERCTLRGNSTFSFGSGGATSDSILVDCSLIGNRSTGSGGGASSGGSATNCIFAFNDTDGAGGAVFSVRNVVGCLVLSNSATVTGGLHGPSLVLACTVVGNTRGGISRASRVENSTLAGNSTQDFGGGAAHSTLINCRLLNNSATYGGGGAYMSKLYGCVVMGNTTEWSGGGAKNSEVESCLVLGNHAGQRGGGVDSDAVLNCTVISNTSAGTAGGCYAVTITNSIVLYNSAAEGDNILNPSYYPDPMHTCTQPLPAGGVDNLDADPLFIDPSAGNYRLQTNSPCVNVGTGSPYPGVFPWDRDGRPRVSSSAVDLGAFELVPGVNGQFLGWLERYGLPTNGSADNADTDLDGFNNFDEWLSGTTPTNPNSFPRPGPRLLSCILANGQVAVTWQSDADAPYALECATNLTGAPFEVVASNIVGQAGVTTFLHTNGTSAPMRLYRIRLE